MGWFAALRRDRLLFAIAASLVLLAHLFQPLAEARAASKADGWVICTVFGMQKAQPGSKLAPSGTVEDCPSCIMGPCAGMAVPLRVAAPFDHAFAAPVAFRDGRLISIESKIPPERLNEPPPAIRAPPSVLA